MLGRVSGASASYHHAGALDGRLAGPAAWMLDRRRAGAGALTELGIHLIDAFAALGQLPRLEAVTLDRGPNGSTDLGGVAVGRWGDVPLDVRASWVTRPAGLELTITGAHATAVIRDGTLEIVAEAGAGERWIGAPPDAGESLRSFAAKLRTRRLRLDGLTPVIRAHEVLERAVAIG